MHDEDFLSKIRTRLTDHRTRHGKQAAIIHLLKLDEIVRMVKMLERKSSPWGIKPLAKAIGVASSTMCQMKNGRKPGGTKWPELAEALSQSRSNPMTEEFSARKANGLSGVKQVIRYEDEVGMVHETPEAAHHANESRRVREAAARFADWLSAKSLGETTITDVLVSDEAGYMMLAIVAGRFALAT